MINEQHVLTSSNGQDTGERIEIGMRTGTNGTARGMGTMPICGAFLVTRRWISVSTELSLFAPAVACWRVLPAQPLSQWGQNENDAGRV